MKVKTKIKGFDGKTITREIAIPSKDHLEAQKNFPPLIYRNKKKYSRKTKHRKGEKQYEEGW